MNKKIEPILKELQKQLRILYKEQLVSIILFGSHARHEAQLFSDIDVMVVLKGEVHSGKEISRTGKFISSLSLQYDTVLSCVFVSADRFAKEKSPLFINVHHEGVLL